MVFSSFLFMGASKFSIVPVLMLTRYPDHIELMEDMLKTSNELKELTDKVINLVTKEFQVDEIIFLVLMRREQPRILAMLMY